MQDAIGDILNGLVLGVLLPLSFLPAAALFSDRSKTVQTITFLALTLGVILAVVLFAELAVDLAPIRVGLKQAAPIITGVLFFACLIQLRGAKGLAGSAAAYAEPIVRSAAAFARWLVYAMALIQFAVVILRYVFGLNFIFMQESVTYLHGFVFLIAAGYALLTDDHVRVDIFYRDATTEKRAIVDLAGAYLLLFPFCFVLLWAAGPYVASAWSVLEGSTEQSGIQGVFLLKSLIPVFAVLLLLAGVVLSEKAVRSLLERDVH